MAQMQNTAGAPQANNGLMYYYVAVPTPGQGGAYGQGGDGMNQGGPFDGQQGFQPGQPVYYPDQDSANMGGMNVGNMGHMSTAMMPSGQGGNMVPGGMMVLTSMMQGGQMQQQAPPQMDQGPQDMNQAGGAWQGMGQQTTHDSQPTPSGVRPKAFKIVNPRTNEEVGRQGPGGPDSGQSGGQQNVQGGRGHDVQNQPVQNTQLQPQSAWAAGPPNTQGFVPQSGNQQQAQSQQQQTSTAPAPAAATAAGSKKKMMNKKIEKPKADAGAPAAQGGGSGNASAAGDTGSPASPAPGTTPQTETSIVLASTPATTTTVVATTQPPKEGQEKDAPKSGARSASNLPTLPSAPGGNGGGTGGGGGGGNTGSRTTDMVNVRSPQSFLASLPGQAGGGSGGGGGGGQSSSFASSIKALNLEPMRANTAPFQNKRSGTVRPHSDLGLAQVPTQFTGHQNQQNNQTANQGQAASNESAAPKTAQTGQTLPQTSQQQSGPQPPQGQQQATQQQQQQPAQQQQQAQSQAQQQSQAQPQSNTQQQQQQQMQQQQIMQQQMMQQQMMQQQMQQPPMQAPTMPQQMVLPMQQQQPQPAAAPQATTAAPPAAAAATTGTKWKGIKLKNAALVRPKAQKTDEETSAQAVAREEEPARDDAAADSEAGAGSAGATQDAVSREAVASVPTPPRRLDLKPPDGIFDRSLLLRIWRANKGEPHQAVSGLHVNQRPGDKGTPTNTRRSSGGGAAGRDRGGHDMASDRANVFGTDMKTGKKKETTSLLKTSEKGYRVQEATQRDQKIEREVRSLLNKICPDNLKTIVERLALIELFKASELEHVIGIIFQKALFDSHYCETYADMVFALRTRYPEFPAENENEKAITFTRVLLNTCQNEFESLPTTFEPTEEEIKEKTPDDLRIMLKKRKDKMLANMKFIGNLFLRQLLAVKVIGQVVHDLIGIRDGQGLPEEHMIECVCELLQAIGHTLDTSQHGKMLMQNFALRLLDLKAAKQGPQHAYSKRIQFQIQDLLDLRSNNWQKKLFKEQAKTKAEVRKDAQKESKAKGGTETMFQTATVGVRPAYIDDLKATKPSRGAKADTVTKPTFDQAHVKKCFHYFADEKNGQGLQEDWMKPQPTPAQSKQGVEWLAEIGFNDMQKEDLVAQTIVELMTRQVVNWNVLAEGLQGSMETLEDMKIDVPHCCDFVHSLLARLLMAVDRNFSFNPVLLKQITSAHEQSGSEFAWGLLAGVMRKVKKIGGQDAYRKALDAPGMTDALSKVKGCNKSDVSRLLQEEMGRDH